MTIDAYRGRCPTCGHDHDADNEPRLAVPEALTPEEAAEAAKAVRNSLNPAGGMFIAKGWNVILGKLDAIAEAGVSATRVPDGWKLVPIQPTPEMVKVAEDGVPTEDHENGTALLYKAMLAAAPLYVGGKS